MSRSYALKAIAFGVALFMFAHTSHAAFDADLQFGARGAATLELQKLLISQGYLSGAATGNFLSLTKQAVIKFQKASNVPATGYVGPLTRAKLRLLAVTPVVTIPVLAATSSVNVPTVPTTITSAPPVPVIPFYVAKTIWEFSDNTSPFQLPATNTPPVSNFIDPSLLIEKQIDPRSVVLVRCLYVPDYSKTSYKGSIEPQVFSGSGVVISPEGHILTAGHILNGAVLLEDPGSNVTWTRKACDVAQTSASLTPIDPSAATSNKTRFDAADIVFEPSATEFNVIKVTDPDNPGRTITLGGGADLDFALLQVKDLNLPYAPISSKLLSLKPGEKTIGLGYPGVVGNPYNLERIDGQFDGYIWSEYSTCVGKMLAERCGVSYQTKRYKNDYKKLYGVQSELGKYTSYFRGGFSGGPLFYKGNVIGIITFGRENSYTNLYDLSTVGLWNWVVALSSNEIVTTLKMHGINLTTVP